MKMETVDENATFKKNTHFINEPIRRWPGFRKTDIRRCYRMMSIRKKQFVLSKELCSHIPDSILSNASLLIL